MGPDHDDGARRGTASAPGPETSGLALLADAVACSPLPMVLADPNLPGEPVVLANDAFLRMTGYDRSEILGRDFRLLQGSGADPEVAERVGRAIRSRGDLAVEVLHRRKDGTPYRAALFLSPVRAPGGEVAYLLAAQVDVSPGRSRGGALGRVVGEVAHDLANLVQVIAGSVELLKTHAAVAGDERMNRRASAIAEAARRATALSHRLLAASRGPEGEGFIAEGLAPRGEAADERAPGMPGPRGGERILVVDDRAEIAELARTMLEHAGYRVAIAAHGRQALDRLAEGFDLLFTDLVMPGPLDGVALAREARRLRPGLKVLLTTGHVEVRADGPRPEFDTIAKPYRRAELVEKIRLLLDEPDGGDRG